MDFFSITKINSLTIFNMGLEASTFSIELSSFLLLSEDKHSAFFRLRFGCNSLELLACLAKGFCNINNMIKIALFQILQTQNIAYVR